jgi:methyl-accepting chemotaxis protein
MFTWFDHLKVRTQISIGFAIVILILIGTISFSIVESKKGKDSFDRLVELRMPTAQNTLKMLNGINHSLAALRGWIILGKDKFKDERDKSWGLEIEPAAKEMLQLSKNWTNPENVKVLNQIKHDLEKFKQFQKEIEDIAQTIENTPANKMLLNEAAPQAAIIVSTITEMIDAEAKLEATPERKELLGIMADVRGSMGLALANIRAFLLSGDPRFEDKFKAMWSKNDIRFSLLTTKTDLLTPDQQASFERLKLARKAFAPLPLKMLKIRGGKEWNQANLWLGTKAAPTAFRIKQGLDSMLNSQSTLLTKDTIVAKSDSEHFNSNLWLSLILGTGLSIFIAWAITTLVLRKLTRAWVESDKITAVVENLPINVMLADKNLQIQYVNPATRKTLKSLQDFIPVSAESLIGENIDVFHKDPKMQRQLLDNPSNLPIQTLIKVGNETIDLLVSAVRNKNGEYLGPMAAWTVVTEKIAMQERERRGSRELQEKVDKMLVSVDAASHGDLTCEVGVSGDDAIGKMGEGLAEFINKLRVGITKIAENTEQLDNSSQHMSSISQQLASNAHETSKQSSIVSEASGQVSASVETVSAGAQEMSASIREISKAASDAAQVSQRAVDIVETTNKIVQKLGDSSGEIGQVIKVINSIAEQTNLLALNATIEAARAGEAGKGFAVVANEVKDLAKETSKATEDIAQRIESIQQDTGQAVSAIDEITEVIKRIDDISGTIASAVEEQTATTSEIERNIHEASNRTLDINENISGVAQAAEDTSVGASQTSDASGSLSKMVSDLKDIVSAYKLDNGNK